MLVSLFYNMEIVAIGNELDQHLEQVTSYIVRGDLKAIEQLYDTAIVRCASRAFELLFPHVGLLKKMSSMDLLAMHGTSDMMMKIHIDKPFPFNNVSYTQHPLWTAILFDNYDVVRWMLEFGYIWKHRISPFYAVVHPNVGMLKLLYKYGLCDEIAPMLQYTLRHILCSEGSGIYPLSPPNYDNESLEFLFFLHENFPVVFSGNYQWECTSGDSCYFCKEALRRKEY